MYNFVLNYSEEEISDYVNIKSLSEFADKHPKVASKIFAQGDLTWCLQTYLNLSRFGTIPVTCSNKLAEDKINIIHSGTLLDLKGEDKHFIVCVQADYPERPWSHYDIIQNKSQVSETAGYIPHWVQPGLIKRNAERRGVKRVAYSGVTYNHNLAGSEASWKRLLEPHGIEFVVLSNDQWRDMSEIDVLIGIRSFDSRSWDCKPPSKLFNAWHAEIPFIGGNDSAFKQVGTPGENYLLVQTQDEAVARILELQNTPELYTKLVNNGRTMASNYTVETITRAWEDLLTNQVVERYKLWKNRSGYERVRFNVIQQYSSILHLSKQFVRKKILGGYN